MDSEIIGGAKISLDGLIRAMEKCKLFPYLLQKWKLFGECLDISIVQLDNLGRKVREKELELESIPRELIRLWKYEQRRSATLGVLCCALDKSGLKDFTQFLLQKFWDPEITIKFLTSCWIEDYGAKEGDCLEEFARKCLLSLEESMTDNEREIAGMYGDDSDMPLSHLMISQVYAKDAKAASTLSTSTLPENSVIPMSFFKLFNLFMEQIFRRIPDHISREAYRIAHVRDAFSLLFPEWFDAFQEYLNVNVRIDENMLSYIELIERDMNANTGKFLHRTYAEYLLAEFIVQNLGKHGTFGDFLFGEILGRKGTSFEKGEYGHNYYKLKHPELSYFIEKHLQNYLEDHDIKTLILPKNEYGTSTKYDCADVCVAISACSISGLEKTFDFTSKVLSHFKVSMKLKKQYFNDLLHGVVERSESSKMLKMVVTFTRSQFTKGLSGINCPQKILKIRASDYDHYSLRIYNFTPLHMAVMKGNYKFVSCLTQEYRNDDVKNMRHLLHACVNGSLRDSDSVIQQKILIVDLLVMLNPAWLKQIDNRYRVPLLQHSVHLDLLNKIVELGADINAKVYSGETILHKTETDNRINYMKRVRWALSKACRLINSQTEYWGRSPLMDAISLLGGESMTEEELKLFKDAGADFKAKDEWSRASILFYAIKHSNDVDFIGKVLEYGADVNHADKYTDNAAHEVIRLKDDIRQILSFLKLLESKGFKGFSQKNRDGHTPLDLARKKGKLDAELLKYLKDRTTCA